jgi:hypothetical protein
MTRIRAVVAALALVALAACGGDGSPQTTIPKTGSGVGTGSAAATPGSTVTVTTHRRGGTPHHAVIDSVSISADGKAAVSRDVIGEWRIWPALDGSIPTQRLPLDNAIGAEVSTTATGFLVGAVDAADSLDLIQVAADGTVGKRSKIAPDPGIEHLALVGDRAIASRADQAVVAFDAAGKPLARLPLRGARVESLLTAAKDRVLVLLRKAGADPTFEARWLEVGAKIAWGDAIALPAPFAANTDFALSPDARLLAYATTPLPKKKPPATGSGAAGEVAQDVAVTFVDPAAATARIEIFDLQKQKSLIVGDSTTFTTASAIGFMGARDLMVVDMAQGSRIAVDVDAATTATFGDGLPVRTGPTAFAPGVAIAGQMSNLVVAGGDGTVRYLGHKDSAPTTGALSPSGRTAAWLSTGGALIVERLDEESEHVILPDSHTAFSLVELIDDATVVVLSNMSVLQMYDIDSGKQLGDTPVTSAAAMQYSAKTKLLLVPSGNTVWLYELDRAAATPFGKRMVVPETTAFLLDPALADGGVLLGSDGGSIRKYKLEEIKAGVSRAMARDGRVTLPTPLYTFDRAGRPYNIAWRSEANLNGRYLETWPANGKTDPWSPKGTIIAKLPNEIAAVIPSPTGDRYLAYDNRGTLMMFDPKGAVTWSAAMPLIASRVVWSDDGARVMVVSMAGGEIFAAATGASLERACGWRFTSDSTPPSGSPAGVASVCTAPMQR